MAQSTKGKLNYRCPACFARDIDMDMFFRPDTGTYYCLRCSFRGNEREILERYAQIKKRYKLISTRITDFEDR